MGDEKIMAQIIYTCTNQPNTRNDRVVSIANFTASGDTDKNIGLITKIVYEHYHSSTHPRGYELRGSLVFSDGTALVSDTQLLSINANVPRCVNTFANPGITGEQWALLTEVQTLDALDSIHNNSGYYGADLYWRATTAQLMRIIISFEEEPPAYYAPDITEFRVVRVDENGYPDDVGARLAATMKLKLGIASGREIAALRIYYAADESPDIADPETKSIELTGRIDDLLNGASDDTTILPGDGWDVAHTWYFTAVFSVDREKDIFETDVPRAYGSLHISGYHSGGICVCGYSTGTEDEPKFESHAPAYFYEGVADWGKTNLNDLIGLQAGQTEAQRIASGASGEFSITFPKAYAVSPIVTANFAGDLTGSSTGHLGLVIASVTTIGCIVRVGNSSGAAYTPAIAWMAFGTI